MLKRTVNLLRSNISNNGGRMSSSFTYFAEKTPSNEGMPCHIFSKHMVFDNPIRNDEH